MSAASWKVSRAPPPSPDFHCASPRGSCLLDSQQPMTVVELFFGRDIPGRNLLTEREWSDFRASVLSHAFPQGFTVTDGDGEWRDPAD